MPAPHIERETSGDGSSWLKRWAHKAPEEGCGRKQRKERLCLRFSFLLSWQLTGLQLDQSSFCAPLKFWWYQRVKRLPTYRHQGCSIFEACRPFLSRCSRVDCTWSIVTCIHRSHSQRRRGRKILGCSGIQCWTKPCSIVFSLSRSWHSGNVERRPRYIRRSPCRPADTWYIPSLCWMPRTCLWTPRSDS